MARQQESSKQAEQKKHPANHLKGQTSPYLLQHLHNPVDWYPWGKEALEKAKKEDKPIFLSIGYSACHWCHVMERESFENEAIAKVMNAHFVCIKVDREERPDIDEIYMAAVVRMNQGGGGWPMSLFLTPKLKPFLGGTYFPPEDKWGRPGFKTVLERVHELWKTRREDIEKQGDLLVEDIKSSAAATGIGAHLPADEVFSRALALASQRFDPEHGGFGQPPQMAPKFPHVTELLFLLRQAVRRKQGKALEVVETTLTKMARGGIYDQLAGGFARYSVDREWTVPHFEKMLYDNSQLAVCYLEAWQATQKPFYRRIATEILDYELREMLSPEGGFYSTTDADSEGEEGKFFVWSLEEIEAALGEDAGPVCEYYGVTKAGNFEGHNILTNRLGREKLARKLGKEAGELSALLERARRTLYELRQKRVHPGLDDKILSSWNGLMLSALAKAAQVLGEKKYLDAARRSADFLLTKMSENGRLLRTRRDGRTHLDAYLEDYAFVTAGLIDLFEADPDPRWIRAALSLHAIVEKDFADEKNGGYYSTAADNPDLVVRMASAQESSLPSDVGVAAMNAARLGLLGGDTKLVDRARAALKRHGVEIYRYPNSYCQLLLLLDFLEAKPREVYVVGAKGSATTKAFLSRLRAQYPPYRVFAWLEPGKEQELEKLLPAAEGKGLVDGKEAAYVCYEGVCKAPTLDPSKL
ncbi:MAG: thioredoxin domain-containing protein [Planctomycetota bacterium]